MNSRRYTFSTVPRAVPGFTIVLAVLMSGWPARGDSTPATSQVAAGVFVNESVEARRQLQRLAELQSEERWADAARVCEQLIAEHGQTLIRVDERRYISITDHVHEQLAHWPQVAAAYVSLFAEQAERALREKRATDPGCAIIDRYWPTPVGGVLADHLAKRFLESGAPLDAGRIFERLSREHPDYREHAEAAVYAAFAYATAGCNDLSVTSADRARRLGGEILWQGERKPVAEVLERIQAGDHAAATQPADWPMLGGDVSRNRTAFSVPEPDMQLWRVNLRVVPRSRRLTDEHFCLEPVLVEDRVYVQDSFRIWSIDLDTGSLAWQYELEGKRNDVVPSASPSRGVRAPTFADSRLYAVLGEVRHGQFSWQTASGCSELICIDATGKEHWRVAAAGLFAGGSEEDGYFFDSSPLVRMNRVHVVVRRWRPVGYEECYLAGLDAATGTVKYVVHLVGAPTQPSDHHPLVHCDPAAEGDSIYVQTHLGALACVAASAGRIRWLTLEDRVPVAQSARPDEFVPEARRLHPLRFIPSCDPAPGELISVDPRDRSLSLYEADAGCAVRCIDANRMGAPEVVLGPLNDIVYGIGREIVACDFRQDRVLWRAGMPETSDRMMFGRPCLTSDRLYYSTPGALRWVALDGKAEGHIDHRDSLAGGGNVTAVGDTVLVAGMQELLCYTQRSARLARIEERMIDRPKDPSGFLAMAWLSFRDLNDPDRALAAIDRALELSRADQPEVKQRIFNLVIRLIDQIPGPADDVRRDVAQDRVSLVNALLRAAERSAVGIADQLQYRLHFAEVYERLGHPAETVRLCQSILDDRSLRGASAVLCFSDSARRSSSDPTYWLRPTTAPGQDWSVGTGEVAADMARERIARAIESHSRQVYAQYDKAAEELLGAPGARDEEGLLREIFERYPNARVVPEVVLRIAEIRHEVGASAEAIDLLRAFWFERSDLRDQTPARLIAVLAECCFETDRQSDGLRWLARGMRAFPDARLKINGCVETFASLCRRPIDPARNDRMPSLSFPLQFAYEVSERGYLHLIQPAEENDGSTALIFHDGRLMKFEPRTGRRIDWPLSPIVADPPKTLGVSGGLVLLVTPFRILAVDESAGRAAWSFGERPPGLDAASTDPEIATRLTEHVFSEDLVVGLYDDGRAVALRARDGRMLWQEALPRKPAGPLALSAEYLVYASEAGGSVELIVLDPYSGRQLRRLEHDQKEAVNWLCITPGREVIAVGHHFVAGYDPDTSLRLWHVDDLPCTRFDLIRTGLRHAYLPIGDSRLVAIRQQDGEIEWQASLPLEDDEGLQKLWLDGPDLYVMSSRRLWGLDARTGKRAWMSPMPLGHTMGLAVLTRKAILIVSWPRASGDDSQRNVAVTLIHRETGQSERATLTDGGPLPVLHQIAVYDGTLILRGGPRLMAWTAGETGPAQR